MCKKCNCIDNKENCKQCKGFTKKELCQSCVICNPIKVDFLKNLLEMGVMFSLTYFDPERGRKFLREIFYRYQLIEESNDTPDSINQVLAAAKNQCRDNEKENNLL